MSRVLFPTDLTESAVTPYAHALMLALQVRSRLQLVHVRGADQAASWDTIPTVRDLLQNWGVLPHGAGVEAFEKLGIEVDMESPIGAGAVEGVLDWLGSHPTELLVLGTEGRTGLEQLVAGSVAEQVARRAHVPTLFVPKGCRPLVDPETGARSLRRLLVPLENESDGQRAVDAADWLGRTLGTGPVQLDLLHVGWRSAIPEVRLPTHPGWVVKSHAVEGNVVNEVLRGADEHGSDVIVMVTRGHDSLGDILGGSHTEQVVRSATVPVLAVPSK